MAASEERLTPGFSGRCHSHPVPHIFPFEVLLPLLLPLLLPVELQLFQFDFQKKTSQKKGAIFNTYYCFMLFLPFFLRLWWIKRIYIDPHGSPAKLRMFKVFNRFVLPFSRSLCSMGQFPCDAAEINDLNGIPQRSTDPIIDAQK